MQLSSLYRLGLFCMAMACTLLSASAQVILDAPGLTGKPKAAPVPLPRAAPAVWPRLDPGAVICRTEDDLDRHSANMTARVSGGDTTPADCRAINQPIGIQILSRQGPGRTQVQLNGTDITGWTDVWLPDRPPSGR